MQSMDHEEWMSVEGFEGTYQVSNLGRVRSLDRVSEFVQSGRRIYREWKEKNGRMD